MIAFLYILIYIKIITTNTKPGKVGNPARLLDAFLATFLAEHRVLI